MLEHITDKGAYCWGALGIIGGLSMNEILTIVSIFGVVANLAINLVFKVKHFRLAKRGQIKGQKYVQNKGPVHDEK